MLNVDNGYYDEHLYVNVWRSVSCVGMFFVISKLVAVGPVLGLGILVLRAILYR